MHAAKEAEMGREKKNYEYVMDVALRSTLKEHGFKRKTYATYIRETDDRVWIFELEADPWMGVDFSDAAGVRIPELDRIFEHSELDWRPKRGGTRTPSHATATLLQLLKVATGRDYQTYRRGLASNSRSKEYKAAQNDPVMRHVQITGRWGLRAGLPSPEEGEAGWERFDHRMDELIEKFGLLFNDLWIQYALPWYERCNDPLFVAKWLVERNHAGKHYLTLAALHHLGGDETGAANYLQRCFDEASVGYDQLHRTFYKQYHHSWLETLWRGHEGWSDEKIAELTEFRLNQAKLQARDAGKLSEILAIKV